MSINFVRPVARAYVFKNEHVPRRQAVRLYLESVERDETPRWALQIHAPVRRTDGSEGASFFYADAFLGKPDLLALRSAIDEALAEVEKP